MQKRSQKKSPRVDPMEAALALKVEPVQVITSDGVIFEVSLVSAVSQSPSCTGRGVGGALTGHAECRCEGEKGYGSLRGGRIRCD